MSAPRSIGGNKRGVVPPCRRRRPWQVVAAYAVPTFLALVAAQVWFQPGTVIATGDLVPPIAPGPEYRSHWNHVTHPFGGPSYDIVALPYYELLNASAWFGLDQAGFQRVWLSAMFAGSATALVFFTLNLTGKPGAGAAAGLFAAFNAYHLVTPADHIALFTMIEAGVLGGLIVRAGLRGESMGLALAFALVSAGVGFAFVNPPHVAMIAMWLFLAIFAAVAIAGGTALGRILRLLARAVPLAFLVNLWWLVPASLTLFGPGSQAWFPAINVDAWAWTHARASLLNAASLNTAWGWAYAEYFPYAARLDAFPFGILRFCLPLLAILGIWLSAYRDRRAAFVFGAAAVALIWMAKGLHPPLGDVNRRLYADVPGYWLFRDPTKLLLLLSLVYSVLAGIATERLLATRGSRRAIALSAAGILTAGAIAYVHPLFTGEVISDTRPTPHGSHVRVPSAWRDMSRAIDKAPDEGKVLMLPAIDFYQIPTTWRYYGASFARLATSRAVFENRVETGSYLRSPPSVPHIVAAIEDDLLYERRPEIESKLRALGVRFIVVRWDLYRDVPGRYFASAREVTRGLHRTPRVKYVRSFGSPRMFDLYRLDGDNLKVSAVRPIVFRGTAELIPRALEASPRTSALMAGQADAIRIDRVMRLPRSRGAQISRVDVRFEERRMIVRLVESSSVSVNGRSIRARSQRVAFLDSPGNSILSIGRAGFIVSRQSRAWTSLGFARFQDPASMKLWRASRAVRVPLNAEGPVGDCNRYDDRNAEEVGLSARVVARDRERVLRLAADDHAACVSFPVEPFDPRARYRVSFKYRRLRGSPARACLWQTGPERCAPLPTLDSSPGWHQLNATVAPESQTERLSLFFYADGDGENRTITEYRDVIVQPYRLSESIPLRTKDELGALKVTRLAETTVEHTSPSWLKSDRTSRLTNIVEDCNRYDDRNAEEVGLSARVVARDRERVVRLAADDHAACVSFPVEPFDPTARYRVSFKYRRLRGSPARACLWQTGPERCAPLPTLDSSPGWHQLDATVAPEPQTEGLSLFFYADGDGENRTITEYRAFRVSPYEPTALLGIPSWKRLPRIDYRQTDSANFRVSVAGATHPFLLVLAEGFAPGWHLDRTSRRAAGEPTHVRVNGYANGWLIPWKGSYDLVIEYGPERYARAARWISLVTIVALLGWIVWRWLWPAGGLRTRRRAARPA